MGDKQEREGYAHATDTHSGTSSTHVTTYSCDEDGGDNIVNDESEEEMPLRKRGRDLFFRIMIELKLY